MSVEFDGNAAHAAIANVLARATNGIDLQARRFVPAPMLPRGFARLGEWEDKLNRIIRPKVGTARAQLFNGGKLRMLQVGNIAMYGLLNALVLEKADCQTDAICFDFYHFAATPEFHYLADDPSTQNVIGDDHYFTNFWKIDHTKRFRPRWFAQGPLSMCLSYMLIRRCGPAHLQDISWACLEYSRLKAITERNYHPHNIYWDEAKLNGVMSELSLSEDEIANFRIGQAADGFLQTWREVALKHASEEAVMAITPPFPPGFLEHYTQHDKAFKDLVAQYRGSGLMYAAGFELYSSLRGPPPEKPDDMDEADWLAYAQWAHHWRNLFEQYDAAILQAAYPIIAHASGHERYFGYEIGTIRSIPFEDSPLGRQVYVGYKNALGTFVTNSDYPLLENKIEGVDDKAIFTPHAFDEEKVFRFAERHRATMVRPNIPTFLAPARQWWYKRAFTDSKRNDLTMKAARILKDRGVTDFKVEMVKWGPDLEQSQELMDALDIHDVVVWVPTMSRAELWGKTCESAGVIDQFGIPGLGGVAFETMSLGARLLTHTFKDNDTFFFGKAPPIMRAQDEFELADVMEACIKDPLDDGGVGTEGVTWIRDWHSAQRSADIARKAFKRFL